MNDAELLRCQTWSNPVRYKEPLEAHSKAVVLGKLAVLNSPSQQDSGVLHTPVVVLSGYACTQLRGGCINA